MYEKLELGKLYKRELNKKDGGTWLQLFALVEVNGERQLVEVRTKSFLESSLLKTHATLFIADKLKGKEISGNAPF